MATQVDPVRYQFTLNGLQDILFHADDIDASDKLAAWRNDQENANVSVRGDDRSPPWTWQSYLYFDNAGNLAWPGANLSVGLRAAGAQLILKKSKTFKEISQSGMGVETEFCEFKAGAKLTTYTHAQFDAIRDLPYAKQAEAVRAMGFRLWAKRARVGQAKHVRCRARFNNWQIQGVLSVHREEITYEVLVQMFDLAGRIGQGDWRPGCKTPGSFGQFIATLKKLK